MHAKTDFALSFLAGLMRLRPLSLTEAAFSGCNLFSPVVLGRAGIMVKYSKEADGTKVAKVRKPEGCEMCW
jgi:hypothetical protein